jgi:hypothetical protein
MNKLFGVILAAAFALAPLATTAQTAPYTYPETTGYGFLYDSGFVTSGAAVTSGVFDATKLDFLDVEFITSTGGATRSVIAECLNRDGVQLYAFPTTTVAADAKARLLFDPELPGTTVGLGIPTGTTAYAVRPCPRMKVGAAAANGSAAIVVHGRKK